MPAVGVGNILQGCHLPFNVVYSGSKYIYIHIFSFYLVKYIDLFPCVSSSCIQKGFPYLKR